MEYLILGNGGMAETYDTPACVPWSLCHSDVCPHLCINHCPVYAVGCMKPGTAGMIPTALGMSD